MCLIRPNGTKGRSLQKSVHDLFIYFFLVTKLTFSDLFNSKISTTTMQPTVNKKPKNRIMSPLDKQDR